MKRVLAALASLAVGALVAACSREPASDPNRLSIAATAIPHAEILELVKPKLAAAGLTLEIKVFTDYVQPNLQVAEGRIDANYFQTEPYLREFNKNRGTDLVTVAGVHIEPFGAYSRKYTALDQLPEGANVVIPNDPSNNSRALLLLNRAGLITLGSTDDMVTLKDITANPKNISFRELESATLPRVLDEVDLALINTNYALVAGLDPQKDALAIEDATSPYVNFLVAKADHKDDPRIAKLAAALRGDDVRKFIAEKYRGAVLPAF